jgi:hypothetical protein
LQPKSVVHAPEPKHASQAATACAGLVAETASPTQNRGIPVVQSPGEVKLWQYWTVTVAGAVTDAPPALVAVSV